MVVVVAVTITSATRLTVEGAILITILAPRLTIYIVIFTREGVLATLTEFTTVTTIVVTAVINRVVNRG
jgi:hypothetical protein